MPLGVFGGAEGSGPRTAGHQGSESTGGIGLKTGREEVMEGPEGAYTVGRVAVGNFTRDLTTATGTQDITGLGGRPYILWISYAIAATAGSWGTGYSNLGEAAATVNNVIYSAHSLTASTMDHVTSTQCIYVEQGGTPNNSYTGSILSIFDGFQITWTKNNSPTGTLQVKYIAYLRG